MEPPSEEDDEWNNEREENDSSDADAEQEQKPAPKKRTRRVKKKDYPEDDEEEKRERKKNKRAKVVKQVRKGETTFTLAPARFVTVKKYKEQIYVDIRDFYDKNGELFPGKRGISLKPEEWEELLSVSAQITDAIEQL